MFVSLVQVCVVYVHEFKEVCHSGGLSQLMGVACKRTCTQATNQQEESKLPIAVVYMYSRETV